MNSKDWRLTREEDWMYGAELRFRPYKAPTQDWDHDHCSLCWQKFAEQERADEFVDAQFEGYASPNEEEWICQTCFDDFRDRFGWRVVA